MRFTRFCSRSAAVSTWCTCFFFCFWPTAWKASSSTSSSEWSASSSSSSPAAPLSFVLGCIPPPPPPCSASPWWMGRGLPCTSRWLCTLPAALAFAAAAFLAFSSSTQGAILDPDSFLDEASSGMPRLFFILSRKPMVPCVLAGWRRRRGRRSCVGKSGHRGQRRCVVTFGHRDAPLVFLG